MSSGAPIETGTPIRYPSVALMCIDSEDAAQYSKTPLQPYNLGMRIDDNSPAQIYINKQNPLMAGYMTRVALTEVNFTWDIPNVNITNNTLTLALWDLAGDPTYPGFVGELLGFRRVEFGAGFYTLYELGEALEESLNTDISDFTDASGTTDLTWTVGVSDQAVFSLELDSDSVTKTMAFQIVACDVARTIVAGDLSGYFIPAVDDDLTFMMGWTPAAIGIQPPPPAGAYQAYQKYTGSYASMQFTPYIDIESNLLTKNQSVADNDSSRKGGPGKLARIYLSNEDCVPRMVSATFNASNVLVSSSDNAIGTRPFTFRREFRFPKQIQWNNTENIDVIDLRVLDHRGRLLWTGPTRPGIAIVEYEEPEEVELVEAVGGNNTTFQFTLQATEV